MPDGLTESPSLPCQRGGLCRTRPVERALRTGWFRIAGLMEYQQTAIVGAQPLPRLDSLAGSHCLEVDQSLSALSGHCSISGSATLIDYAVTHYGSNTLPMLLDGFQQYDSWDSLIPAVFDVAVDEFEAGWRAHVMKRYAQAPEIKENP